jgi:hypothetical protein
MLEVKLIFNVLPNHAEIVGTKERTGKEKGSKGILFIFVAIVLAIMVCRKSIK